MAYRNYELKPIEQRLKGLSEHIQQVDFYLQHNREMFFMVQRARKSPAIFIERRKLLGNLWIHPRINSGAKRRQTDHSNG